MMGTRRPVTRMPSGNGRYYDSHGSSNGSTSDSEESNGSVYTPRADSRSYLLNVRPENRTTFCNIISQLTEETQPCFETTLKARAVSEGGDAKFICIVSGHPEPEVTWYKDDEEMDRYCGLPKYEIFRHGKRHTLQLYKCSEEDAAIYQASARNNKGIVSCSGVLEVGTMTEYKIHQRWFAKLKRKAEAKMREIEQSRRRVKENFEEGERLRALSPERIQRKRRFSFEKTEEDIKSSLDKEELIKVHITDPNSRLQEEMPETVEQPHMVVNGFTNMDTQKEEITTNGYTVPENIEENGKEFLTYVYETVDAITKKTSSKESYAKKKKKEEEPPLPTADSKTEEAIQASPKKVEGISPAPRRSRFGKDAPKTPVEEKMETEVSPMASNKRFAPSTGPSKTGKTVVTKDTMKLKDGIVAINKSEESSIPKPVQTKGEHTFSLKEMFFGDSSQHSQEEKSTPDYKGDQKPKVTSSKMAAEGQTKEVPKAAPRRLKEQRELSAGRKPPPITKPEAQVTGTVSNSKGQNIPEVKPKLELPKVQKSKEVKSPDQVSGKVPIKVSSELASPHSNKDKSSLEGTSRQAHETQALENNRVSSVDPDEGVNRVETVQKLEKLEVEYMALQKAYALLQQQLELSQKAEAQRIETMKAEAQKAEAQRAEAQKAEKMKAEALRAEAIRAEAQRAEEMRAEALRAEKMKAEALRAEKMKAEALRAEAIRAEAQKAEAQRAEEMRAEALRAEKMKAEALRAEKMKAEAIRAEAQKAEAQRAEEMRAEAQKAEAMKLEAQIEAQKAEAQKAEAQRAEAQKAEAMKAEAQKIAAMKAEALKAEKQREETIKAEAQKAEAQREEAVKAEAMKVEAQRAKALEAEAQRTEKLRADAMNTAALKARTNRADTQNPVEHREETQKVCPGSPELIYMETEELTITEETPTLSPVYHIQQPKTHELNNDFNSAQSSPLSPMVCSSAELSQEEDFQVDQEQANEKEKGQLEPLREITELQQSTVSSHGTSNNVPLAAEDLADSPAQVNIKGTSEHVQDIDLLAQSPSSILPSDQNQSVVTLLRHVKKALESGVTSKEESPVDPVSVQVELAQPKAETHDGTDDNESKQAISKCKNIKEMECATNLPSSEAMGSSTHETAQDASKPQEKQDHGLVTTLKNSLLMLFHIKPSDTEDHIRESKSKSSSAETPSESPIDISSPEKSPPVTRKVYESGKESDSPQSPISMHSTSSSGKLTPTSEEEMVHSPDSLTSPTTARRAVDFKKKGDILQAESAPQSPVTPKRSSKSTNEGTLLTKEDLSFSPATSRKIAKIASGADFPATLSVPSIVVGSLPPEKSLGNIFNESQTDGSRKWRSSENLSAIPSATPQELASGARRKIYLTKPKQLDDEDDGGVDSPNTPRKDSKSPNVSPGLSRRSNALLSSQSPPVERRSPGTSRRTAMLEVPKISEETLDQGKGFEQCSQETKDKSGSSKEDRQSTEIKKVKDPYKAPQVIRKIRAEQFSDASGNLKLWCQFFNILSDSDITWYKDEVQVAKVKRCGGDEGQVALAIVQASEKDCGVYQCSIENEYGTDSTDCLLSAEILSGFINKEEVEVGEEIEVTPMVFAKGLADSGYWGDKFFGRIVMEEPHAGKGFMRKSCRVKVIYGLEPMFESGKTCIIKIRNLITFGTKNENTLVEKNYDITIQECKTQNTTREYCKIFAAECRGVSNFGQIFEILPLNLIYRPANNIPYATIEEDLEGRFEKFCIRDIEGKLHMKNSSEIEQKCCTFQHWVYQWTNGNFLVTTLEGVGWKLTNIAIATKSKGYQGLKESCFPEILEEFTSAHQCNSYCDMLGLKSLKTMESLQPPAKPKGSRSPQMARKSGSGSAQSSPQIQKKALAVPQSAKKGGVSPKSARKAIETGDPQSSSKNKGNDAKLQ
ncbi:alpha-protein kinase 3 [Gastrophryne carolinensis]